MHAGIVPGVPLAEQEPVNMYTMRNLIRSHGDGSGAWEARDKPGEGCAWAAEWAPDSVAFPGVRHICFGHDAKRGLQRHPHTTGIDTGACYGNQLSALVLPERRLFSVPARRVYTAPAGEG